MLAYALAVVLGVASVADVAPPRSTGGVVDQAHVLDDATIATLDGLADHMSATFVVPIAIVTVDSVPGVPHAFADALLHRFALQPEIRATGVLVLLVMSTHRLEIATGNGVQVALGSEWLAGMEASTMVPRFKQRDFGGGLVAGVQAIADHLAALESATPGVQGEYRSNGQVVAPTTATSSPPGDRGAAVPLPAPAVAAEAHEADAAASDEAASTHTQYLVLAGICTLALVVVVLLAERSYRRARTCTTCKPARRMVQLDEVADDAYLDAGQRAEERLGSVDYVVLICQGCQLTRTLRHRKWGAGLGKCNACGYVTKRVSSLTLVEADYVHGGEIEVTESCENCPYVSTFTRSTPIVPVPSLSGSSASDSSSSGSSYSFDSSSSSSSDSSSSSSSSDSGSSGGAGSDW